MATGSAKSDFLENSILNHVLRNTNYASPASVYVALYTTMPSEANTGGVEVTGGGYSRKTCAFAAPTSGANGQQVANSATVDFGTASANWGTVVGMGLLDAASGGNLLYLSTLAAAKTVISGDQVRFDAATIIVSED